MLGRVEKESCCGSVPRVRDLGCREDRREDDACWDNCASARPITSDALSLASVILEDVSVSASWGSRGEAMAGESRDKGAGMEEESSRGGGYVRGKGCVTGSGVRIRGTYVYTSMMIIVLFRQDGASSREFIERERE